MAARNAYTEIDQGLDGLGATLDAYNISRSNFINELKLLFDAWVDILVDCPAADREDLADQLGISVEQLDAIRRKIAVINQRILTNQDFTREKHAIMRFINSYQDILAKIPGIAKPALSAEDQAYAASIRPASTASHRLGQLGIIRAPPAAPGASVNPAGLFSGPGPGWSSSLAAASSSSGSAPAASSSSGGPAASSSSGGPAAEPEPPVPPLFTFKDANGLDLAVGDPVTTVRSGKGATVRNLIPPDDIEITLDDGQVARVKSNGITKRASGGKSKRFKKTKKRRQKKSRKNKYYKNI